MDSEAALSIWLNMFDMLCKQTGLKLVPNQQLEAEAPASLGEESHSSAHRTGILAPGSTPAWRELQACSRLKMVPRG